VEEIESRFLSWTGSGEVGDREERSVVSSFSSAILDPSASRSSSRTVDGGRTPLVKGCRGKPRNEDVAEGARSPLAELAAREPLIKGQVPVRTRDPEDAGVAVPAPLSAPINPGERL